MASKNKYPLTCFNDVKKNSFNIFFPFFWILLFIIPSTYANDNFGINCSADQLKKGTCSMDVYKTLGITPKNKDLATFTQDFIFGATMFIGFVVFVAITYSGFLMITGGADEKQFENGKKGLIYSLIGLLLVGGAYGIIRFIQFIAKG